MNTYSDGYTVHRCPSPMTLHHACQPPIHLSAKRAASPPLSAAAIMIMYYSTALLFFSPYFLFQLKGCNTEVCHGLREQPSAEHGRSCPTTVAPSPREISNLTLFHCIFHGSASPQLTPHQNTHSVVKHIYNCNLNWGTRKNEDKLIL